MRALVLLVSLVLIGSLILVHASAQPVGVRYVVLYAHSNGATLILNAQRTWGGQKAVDVSHDIAFRLLPALGESLQIYGGITMTFYLRGSATISGTVISSISELRSDGTEIPVPGAMINSLIVLTTQTSPVTLGVGIINYTFGRGASIVLHVQVQEQSSAIPSVVWDDPTTPTNLRLPAASPTQASFHITSSQYSDRIMRVNDTANQASVMIHTNLTDAFGVDRLIDSSLRLTAPDGTVTVTPVQTLSSSNYEAQYSITVTLAVGRWQAAFVCVDSSGNQYSFSNDLWVSRFHPVDINVADSVGSPLQNVSVTVDFANEVNWAESTNSSGWVVFSLPDSAVVGPLNSTMMWRGTQTMSTLNIMGPSTFHFHLNIYNIGVRVLLEGIVPVPFTSVSLTQGKVKVAETQTGIDGVANFKQTLQGNYTVHINYLLTSFEERISIDSDQLVSATVPTPHRTSIIFVGLAVVGVSTYVWAQRRRTKLYPQSFRFFGKLVHGELPKTCFTVVAGNAGSGKSALVNTLVADHLAYGPCIFITNTEYPEAIRQNMIRLGVLEGTAIDSRKVTFIDAYSAVGGTSSKEERHVTSHTDLTSLGLEISKALETSGPNTDVYLDSLTPLANVLRMDYLLNFMQSIAAKVKANDGKLCLTIGSGLEKGDMTKLEEVADCVIEMQLQESSRGQRRRLRVKKLRDHPYDDKWARFQVEEGKGIIFLTRTKPERA